MLPTFLALVLSAPGFSYESPDGFRLTLPAGFLPSLELPHGETAALPIPVGSLGTLQVVFVDAPEGSDAGVSSIALALVNAPLVVDTGSPERVADQAISYVRDVLGSELHLEWVERVSTAAPGGVEGLELAGRAEVGGEDRVTQLAFLPFGKRQILLMASMPASRFSVLGQQIEQSVQGLAFARPPEAALRGRAVERATIGAILGLLVALGRLLWRRKREAPQVPPIDSAP